MYLVVAAIALALGACGDDGGGIDPTDSGPRADTGTAATDAGSADAGPAIGEPTQEAPGTGAGCCSNEIGLGLGTSGEPRMIGLHYMNGDLWFASKSAGVWTEENVSTTPSTERAAFAVASDDSPHVLVTSFRDLYYVYRSGTTWMEARVGTDSEVSPSNTHFDIATDASNAPHVAFLDYQTRTLMYGSWNGSSFDLEVVDAPTVTDDQRGEYATLTVGSDGSVHVSYLAIVDGTHTLRYAKGPGTWTTTDVPGMGKGVYGSIMLDVSGNPHIISTDLRSRRARGVYWSSHDGSWSETEVSADIGVVAMDAALDSTGAPHIIIGEVRAFGYGPWVYYRWNGSAFDKAERPRPEVPPGAFDPGPSPPPESVSIAVDSMDKPHIGIPNGYITY